jgi:ATP-dependent Lhr-like helicase
VTAAAIAASLNLPVTRIDAALIALQAEGFAMKVGFTPGASQDEWCERRLLARIHRYTVKRLRAEIEPVQARDFLRFLFDGNACCPRLACRAGCGGAVLNQLEGFEAPASAWETEILPARIANTSRRGLDEHCLAGRFVWTRLASRNADPERGAAPVRSTPITLLARRNVKLWSGFAEATDPTQSPPRRATSRSSFKRTGRRSSMRSWTGLNILPVQAEEGLAELVALGLVNSDSFGGLRALLVPSDRRPSNNGTRRRRRVSLFGMADAGRWALVRRPVLTQPPAPAMPRKSNAPTTKRWSMSCALCCAVGASYSGV